MDCPLPRSGCREDFRFCLRCDYLLCVCVVQVLRCYYYYRSAAPLRFICVSDEKGAPFSTPRPSSWYSRPCVFWAVVRPFWPSCWA